MMLLMILIDIKICVQEYRTTEKAIIQKTKWSLLLVYFEATALKKISKNTRKNI